MKNGKILQMFQETFLQMNIKKNEIEETRSEMLLPHISAAEFQNLQTGSIDIKDMGAFVAEFPSPKPFTYKERPVFIYIHDQLLTKEKFDKRIYDKFHLCYCEALKKAKRENRLTGRYVVTCRKTGTFPVVVRNKNNTSEVWQEETLVPLRVCRNCLAELNWKKARIYQGILDKYYKNESLKKEDYSLYDEYNYCNREMNMFARTFNLARYLQIQKKVIIQLKKQEIKNLQLVSKNALMTKQYGGLTPKDKLLIKKVAGYCCCRCGKRKNPEELQIHHANHNQGDNAISNLKVVCKDCHRAIHEIEGGVVEND